MTTLPPLHVWRRHTRDGDVVAYSLRRHESPCVHLTLVIRPTSRRWAAECGPWDGPRVVIGYADTPAACIDVLQRAARPPA